MLRTKFNKIRLPIRSFQIDPSVDYRTGHPRKYPIRRKNNRQRQLYQLTGEEVLMNQITQPYYPSVAKQPGLNYYTK